MMLAFVQSDRAVMRKVLGGNLGAFRVLVDRYGGVVHGVAYARLRNTADAEDIAQETFVRFYQQLDQMAHRKYIGPWLVRVARNVSVDLVRKRGRDAALAERQEGERVAIPNPAREELHRILYEQLDGLDAESREVLILYYFMRKKAREIAALLEITPDAAAKRLQRARDELGRRLTDLLGEELDEVKADALRGDRIMALIVAAPVAWKVSAAGAAGAVTAAGVATGAGVAKLAAAVAVLGLAAVLSYLVYERYTQPLAARDLAARSEPKLEQAKDDVGREANSVSKAQAGTDEHGRTRTETPTVQETAEGEVAYAPVYGTVRGVVTMEDGTPAADAEVWLDNQGEVTRSRGSGWRSRWYDVVEPLRYSTRTDASGWYEITGFPLMRMDRSVLQFVVHGEKSGQYDQFLFRPTVMEREVAGDLTLRPVVAFGGVVKGRDGKPVEGASVHAEAEEPQPRGSTLFLYDVPTDSVGRFVFEHAPAGRCRLSVTANGYLHYDSDWLTPGRTDYELQLESGLFVSGRVVDVDTGEGVAEVAVAGSDPFQLNQSHGRGYFRGETDGEGYFEIGGCTPGTYEIRVINRRDPFPLLMADPQRVTVGSESLSGVEIRMARGAVLRGTIIDEETGLPVAPGSRVWGGHRECASGEGGSYELVGLAPGEMVLTMTCGTGLTRAQRYFGRLTLNPGEMEKRYDIRLPARRLLAGTVVDELGEAVPWAAVCMVAASEFRMTVVVLADERGRWSVDPQNQLQDDPKTPAVYLQAMSDDGYGVPLGPFEVGKARSGVTLRVMRSGRLEGEVVTREGQPVEHALVVVVSDSATAAPPVVSPGGDVITLPDTTGQTSPLVDPVVFESLKGRRMEKHVGKGGRFEYAQVRPGTYTLEVYPSYADDGQLIATARVSVQPGQTATTRLVVDKSSFGTVEGVVSINGKVAEGVRLRVNGREAVTRTDGRYKVTELAPEEGIVTLWPPAEGLSAGTERTQHIQVFAGEVTRADFELAQGGGTIEGYVTKNGQPEPGERLTVTPAESPDEISFTTVTTDEQGFYRLEHVPEGDYGVSAENRQLPATVVSGGTTRVDFESRAGSIRCTVTGLRNGEKAWVMVFPAEASLSGWTAEALAELGAPVADTYTRGDGPVFFYPVEEGTYWLAVAALPVDVELDAESALGGRIALSAAFTVSAGQTAEVGLDLK